MSSDNSESSSLLCTPCGASTETESDFCKLCQVPTSANSLPPCPNSMQCVSCPNFRGVDTKGKEYRLKQLKFSSISLISGVSQKNEHFWLCSTCIENNSYIKCKKIECMDLIDTRTPERNVYCYDHRCIFETCVQCTPGNPHKCGKCGMINHHSDFQCTTGKVISEQRFPGTLIL